MTISIKIQNLSKQYRLGLVSSRTLRNDLNRWYEVNILGNEDPNLKIGEEKDKSFTQKNEYIWALRDVNLEVEEGENLGIIGKNGAGKSTLLKILSKITKPTTGIIQIHGRLASLLEVGTGFHEELTGRENIYMNGAILGMKKSEIKEKLDEIIDFSGVGRYIDTPVKRYSSGMMVRLGFAVAAHLEPEILIVDEVLAVGDAEFQKKAMGKMHDISSRKGKTVLFVSHNLTAINDLCRKAILFENGKIVYHDFSNKVVTQYLSSIKESKPENKWFDENAPGDNNIKLRRALFIDSKNNQISCAYVNQEIGLFIEYEVINSIPYFTHGINVYNSLELLLFTSHDDNEYKRNLQIEKGFYRKVIWIPKNLLQSGKIEISFACMRYNPFEILFHEYKIMGLNILDSTNSDTRNENYFEGLPGVVRPKLKWVTV